MLLFSPTRLVDALIAGSDRAYIRRITFFLALYCLLHMGLRFLLSPTIGWDDSRQVLWANDLEWVYTFHEPSLYTWILWGMFQVFGKTVFATTIIRYLLIFGTLFLLFRTAVMVFEDRRKSLGVATAYLLIYVFAFYAHHDLTHSTILAFCLALTWFCFCRLKQGPHLPTYALLGLAITMGCLSKYNFPIFVGTLFLAAFTFSHFRKIFLHWGFSLTVVIAIATFAPYLINLAEVPVPVNTLSNKILGTGQGLDIALTAKGLADLLLALLEFPQPWLLASLFLFPEAFRAPLRGDLRSLLVRTFAIALVLLMGLVLVMGATNFKGRWMHPILITLPFWFFAGNIVEDRFTKRLGRYLQLMLLFSVAAFAARIAVDQMEPRNSEKLRRTLPVTTLKQPVTELGFNQGLLIAETNHLAGNLTVVFPQARIISLQNLALIPEPDPDLPRLYLWFENFEHDIQQIEGHLRESTGRDPAEGQRGHFEVAMPTYPQRKIRFGYLVLP